MIMAFVKPTINTIKSDIKNVSIYLRSVKKFGKSTLFRDVILAKYGDPSRGLLVEVGMERGAALLDNVNTTHVDSYKDLIELQKWLIEEKGKEHNIEIVGYDVADELVPLFDKETIRQHNIENPQKMVKSIKAAMGGYTAGEQHSATLMKNYFDKIKSADIQVWVLGHSKYKNIKDKANVDNEGYMQLSSNLGASYEAALGDIFDVVLTGIIDRNIETVGEGDNAKNYLVSEERRLYLRATELIDAGSRFAPGAVPDYIVFDGTPEEFAVKLIKTIEDGMENSKSTIAPKKTPTPKKSTKKPPVVEKDEEEDDLTEKLKAMAAKTEVNEEESEIPFDIEENLDIFEEDVETVDEDPMITLDDARLNAIRESFKASSPDIKKQVKTYLANYGGRLVAEMKQSDVDAIESVLGLSDKV
jgi:hypothetical protein